MNNSDTLLLICSKLNNPELEKLVYTSLWSTIAEFAKLELFWYMRVQHLLQRKLTFYKIENCCWKKSYYLLLQYHTRRAAIFFCVDDELSVRVLLDAGRDPGACNNRAVLTAADFGHERVLRLLLAHKRVDPLRINLASLISYSGERSSGCMKLLLEDGRIDPTSDTSLLNRVVYRGHECLLGLLLEDGRCNPAADGSYCLWTAINTGRVGCVKLLLEDGRVDTRPRSCMKIAIARNNLEIIQLLKEYEANAR